MIFTVVFYKNVDFQSYFPALIYNQFVYISVYLE